MIIRLYYEFSEICSFHEGKPDFYFPCWILVIHNIYYSKLDHAFKRRPTQQPTEKINAFSFLLEQLKLSTFTEECVRFYALFSAWIGSIERNWFDTIKKKTRNYEAFGRLA